MCKPQQRAPLPSASLQDLIADEVFQGLQNEIALAVADKFGVSAEAVDKLIAELIDARVGARFSTAAAERALAPRAAKAS